VEIIPQHPEGVVFSDNNADASGFVTPAAPAVGDHITVTGPEVIDKNLLHRILYQGARPRTGPRSTPRGRSGLTIQQAGGSPTGSVPIGGTEL
jgi:hypothetical protein